MKDLNRTQAGTFTFLKRVGFSRVKGRGVRTTGFTGTADVYSFQAADPKCKVAYAAVVTGVAIETLCSRSGDVGAAILSAAGLAHAAKNSGVKGEYDTFPDPIGCPASRLQARDPEQALTFYRK